MIWFFCFCMYVGLWFRGTIVKNKSNMVIQQVETNIERIKRLIGNDINRFTTVEKDYSFLLM
jgi:hypothetical protein